MCYTIVGGSMHLKLKNMRIEKGLSIKKMADMIGISKAFYCQIENGKRRLSYDIAIRIALVFNVKPDYIFYDDFKKENI